MDAIDENPSETEERAAAAAMVSPTEEKASEAAVMGNTVVRPAKHLNEEELRPTELRGLMRRLAAVFMPFPGLDKFLETLRHSKKRVIVVSGDEGSGRLACAVWLGMQLTARQAQTDGREPEVRRLPESTFIRYDLDALQRFPSLRENGAYIVEEPFRAGLQMDSLPEVQLAAFNVHLYRLDSWIILTDGRRGCASRPTLQARFPWYPIPENPAQDFLAEILARHLEWAGGVGSELPGRIKTAAVAFVRAHFADSSILLNTAPRIYRFAYGLLEAKIAADASDIEASLIRLATDMADESRPRQAWFSGLSPNAQFLALLAGAFEGISRSDLEDIYYSQVRQIRTDEPGLLEDPRRRGFEELYREIRLDINGGELQFIAESYRTEVLRQMGFWHHLLWEVVISVQERMTLLDRPWQWSQRMLLGCAVARLGIHRPEKLGRLLDVLADHDQATVASLPGYILRGACLLDEPHYTFVCELLDRWVTPDPTRRHGDGYADEADLLWAASDAIQRIYVELSERLREEGATVAECTRMRGVQRHLEEIVYRLVASRERYKEVRAQAWAEDEYNEVVANSVLAMFRKQPGEMGKALLRWLDAPGTRQENLGVLDVAAMITRRLFEAHRNPESLPEDRRDALLTLIGPILQSHRSVVDQVLEILRGWVPLGVDARREVGDPSVVRQPWGAAIQSALLQACTAMSEGQRRGLRRGLMTLWLGSPEREVRAIAEVVICRARLLEGVPTDVPGGAWGGIFMDASAAGRVNDTSHRLLRELFALLRAQTDLWVAQPGNQHEICQLGEALDIDVLPSRPRVLRTVAPWLERLAGQGIGAAAFHLAIFWESLVDAEDTAMAAGGTPMLFFKIEGWQEDELGHVDYIFKQLKFPAQWISASNEKGFESTLLMVEREFSPCLSRRLATRDGEEWWRLLLAQNAFADTDAAANRREGAEAALEHLVQHLAPAQMPADERSKNSRELLAQDPLRVALGIVQWLASDDLAATVRLLLKWMRARVGARASVAQTAAIMLLRIHSERMLLPAEGGPAGVPPPARTFAELLAFAPVLARRRSRLGINVLLTAVRRWLTDPEWAAALLRDTRKASALPFDSASDASFLLGMTAALPRWMHLPMEEALFDWTKAAEGKTADDIPPAAFALSLRLRHDLALRAGSYAGRTNVHPVGLGKFTLVVLCGNRSTEGRRGVGDLAGKLYARWEQERLPVLERYVFVEAGSRVPLAVAREGAAREAFDTAASRAATLAPALETLDSEVVRAVVILASEGIIDCEDLPEWLADEGKLHLFWVKPALCPRPAGWREVSWCELDSTKMEESERKMLEQLEPCFQDSKP